MSNADLSLPSTSTSLLSHVQAQNAEAWRRLAHIYGPSVYRWCRKAGLQPADAADVVQEVFHTVAGQIHRFGHTGDDSFRGWLWTIFRSRLMDHFRRRKLEPLAAGGSELAPQLEALMFTNTPPAAHEDEAEANYLVQRALDVIRGDFQQHVWQAFWRSVVHCERTRDIATILSMTPAAVCMARARVLQRLRETLAGIGILDGNGGI